jgi:hypothetical protein
MPCVDMAMSRPGVDGPGPREHWRQEALVKVPVKALDPVGPCSCASRGG